MSTGTLGIMKARIADELARSDITSQIAYAISDAVAYYQSERFFFNEKRELTFSTVAAQEFYDSDDNAEIANINTIDYIVLYIGDQPWQLYAQTPGEGELASINGTSTGTPGWYSWYNQTIRLYPVPADVFTVRLGVAYAVALPTDDSDTTSPWMNTAEVLIRSRAKAELAQHVLFDDKLFQYMKAAELDALGSLVSRTQIMTQVGKGRVVACAF